MARQWRGSTESLPMQAGSSYAPSIQMPPSLASGHSLNTAASTAIESTDPLYDVVGGGYDNHSHGGHGGSISSNNNGAGGTRLRSILSQSNRNRPEYRDYPSSTDEYLLPPPILPFSSNSRTSSTPSVVLSTNSSENVSSNSKHKSLSVNFVPHKFSKLHEPGQWSHRQKKGGGRGAFGEHMHRMPEEDVLDPDATGFDAVVVDNNDKRGKSIGHKKKNGKLRWNRFKWALFVTDTILLVYAIGILIAALLVWFDIFDQATVVRTGNRSELIISTIAGSLCLLTSLIGFAGIILNNRAFLSIYNLLLWFCFGFIVAPGYMTYKQRTFNLEGKVNAQWSRKLGLLGRLKIQNTLHCCGYFSPFVEATVSNLCYSRSTLPGCKARYLKFERKVLEDWYTAAFSLVPLHLLVLITGLLSSNHVTYRFGKNLPPKAYRLDQLSMAMIMDEYANDIAQQYGSGLAKEVLEKSSTPPPSEKGLIPNSRHGSFVGVAT